MKGSVFTFVLFLIAAGSLYAQEFNRTAASADKAYAGEKTTVTVEGDINKDGIKDLVIAVPAVLVSCVQQLAAPEPAVQEQVAAGRRVTISAGLPAQTKLIHELVGTSIHPLWEAGDQVNVVFMQNGQEVVETFELLKGEGTTSAVFFKDDSRLGARFYFRAFANGEVTMYRDVDVYGMPSSWTVHYADDRIWITDGGHSINQMERATEKQKALIIRWEESERGSDSGMINLGGYDETEG